MKIRAQIAMVMNLDKCIGCHTCSVTCKQVWTSRQGMEYAWFNNVETKPGVGYPKDWENQERWNGGWKRKKNGKIVPKQGGRLALLSKIFANPNLPEIDDYYEPFTFDYEHLQQAPELPTAPVARPLSLVTGRPMDKIEWGPNWEEILGGEFDKRSQDYNFEAVQKDIYGQFENTFMMYLPRLCEHCLNPACVASCPSGSIYKREEDGIVLIDQDKCRGWRMCVSGCPYKKIYYNWTSGKAEKCIFCYPRIEAGQPTVCSETCVGRIRYLGVLLYDADGIEEAASVEDEQDLYEAQLKLFLDPHDPTVVEQARADGIADNWIEAARRSPTYKMAVDWKIAFPLTPSTARCRWSGMCRRSRPSSRTPTPARSRRSAKSPMCVRCASRCAISPIYSPLAPKRRLSRRSNGCWPCASTIASASSGRATARRRWRRRDYRRRRSRICIAISPSPTMRTASSFRPATAKRRRMLTD